jgi:hypothetical protein
MLINLISISCSSRFYENVANRVIFGGSLGIWDSWESERVMIGSGTCRNPSPILIHVVSRAKTCVIIFNETMFDAFDKCKFFVLQLLDMSS